MLESNNTRKERIQQYELLLAQWDALFEKESDLLAILSNTTGLLKEFYQDKVNWVGFYRLDKETLILGPYQGKPACMRLFAGKGICQKAVTCKGCVIVSNVHAVQDHIACDAASNSEIVVPLFFQKKVSWVLDLDAPKKDQFSLLDALYLQKIADRIAQRVS